MTHNDAHIIPVPKVLEHFFAKYSLESPLRQYLLQQAERVEAEKEAVRRELAPTLRLKENLDEQVRRCRTVPPVGLLACVYAEGERAACSAVSGARALLNIAR